MHALSIIGFSHISQEGIKNTNRYKNLKQRESNLWRAPRACSRTIIISFYILMIFTASTKKMVFDNEYKVFKHLE